MSELASSGPNLAISIFLGAPRLLLPNVLIGFLPDPIEGDVLDFGNGVKERPVTEYALFNSFDSYAFIQAWDFEAGFVKPSHVLPKGLGCLLLYRIKV